MKILTKVLTLTLFINLIVGFVAYRAGLFNSIKSSLQLSPNGGALKSGKTDSLKKNQKLVVKDSTNKTKIDSAALKKRTMMGSSKFGGVFTEPVPENKDSLPQLMPLDSNDLKNRPVLPSSKSGVMFEPEVPEKNQKKKKKKKKNKQ